MNKCKSKEKTIEVEFEYQGWTWLIGINRVSNWKREEVFSTKIPGLRYRRAKAYCHVRSVSMKVYVLIAVILYIEM